MIAASAPSDRIDIAFIICFLVHKEAVFLPRDDCLRPGNRVVGVRELDRSLTERCEPFLLGDYLRQARNTTVQVWTVEEGFGIGSEFSQTCCAANNLRNHEVLFVQVLQFRLEPEPSSRGA